MHFRTSLFSFKATGLVPAILTTSLLGPHSDKTGRKLSLILPVVGELIRGGICVLVTECKLPFQILIVGSVVEGFSGKGCPFLTNLHAHACGDGVGVLFHCSHAGQSGVVSVFLHPKLVVVLVAVLLE